MLQPFPAIIKVLTFHQVPREVDVKRPVVNRDLVRLAHDLRLAVGAERKRGQA